MENGHRERKKRATGGAVDERDIVDEAVDVLTVVIVLYEVAPANDTK